MSDRRTETRVVNLRLEPFTQYIGRPGKGQTGVFGNPFERSVSFGGHDAIDLYRFYFAGRVQLDPEFRAQVEALEGQTLGCFCKNRAGVGRCHGDVIVEYLDLRAKGVTYGT